MVLFISFLETSLPFKIWHQSSDHFYGLGWVYYIVSKITIGFKKDFDSLFFHCYMVQFLLKTINEDITLRYLIFLSTNARPVMKWTMKKFIDSTTCFTSLLIADHVFYIHSLRHAVTRKNSKFSILQIQPFLSRQKYMRLIGLLQTII